MHSSHLTFRKSSHSPNESACIEVAELGSGAAVRDSQHREQGHLAFPLAEWQAFLHAAKQEEL